MGNFDQDLCSIQEARDLARQGAEAAKKMACMTEEQIDRILRSMIEAAEEHAACLAKMAVEEISVLLPASGFRGRSNTVSPPELTGFRVPTGKT